MWYSKHVYTAINTVSGRVDTGFGAAGLNANGTLNAANYAGATYINDMTNLTNGLLQLDTQISTIQTNITNGTLFDQSLNTTNNVTFDTVNTGQGANELYAMNQNVRTTDNVTFNTIP